MKIISKTFFFYFTYNKDICRQINYTNSHIECVLNCTQVLRLGIVTNVALINKILMATSK